MAARIGLLGRLNAVYSRSMAKRPMTTLCIVNGTLALVSDVLAQGLPHILGDAKTEKLAQKQLAAAPSEKKLETATGVGISAVAGTSSSTAREIEKLSTSPFLASYDPIRSVRLIAYSGAIAPLVQKWFLTLDKFFPLKADASKAAIGRIVLKRVAADQLLFAPFGLAAFFGVMATLEGVDVKQRFSDAYVPALLANWKVWPLVQFVNFKFVPPSYRVPFVGSIGIIWTAYLSWLNASAKSVEAEVAEI